MGQTGRVINGVPANVVGTVTVVNADWSFACDSDTSDNELVTITEVQSDNVTVRVKKIS